MTNELYTAFWNRYPHGIEGEEMKTSFRLFESAQKAVDFLNGRLQAIKSVNWAGGYVTDREDNVIYQIWDDGEIEDHRDVQIKASTAKNIERD